MPYYDIDIIRYSGVNRIELRGRKLTVASRVYKNGERARTCNSIVKQVPGMYASVNNITDPATGDVTGYISAAGIPSIAFETAQELDVITPYSVFPTVLFDKAVGMAWWRNMAAGKKMQSEYRLLCTIPWRC